MQSGLRLGTGAHDYSAWVKRNAVLFQSRSDYRTAAWRLAWLSVYWKASWLLFRVLCIHPGITLRAPYWRPGGHGSVLIDRWWHRENRKTLRLTEAFFYFQDRLGNNNHEENTIVCVKITNDGVYAVSPRKENAIYIKSYCSRLYRYATQRWLYEFLRWIAVPNCFLPAGRDKIYMKLFFSICTIIRKGWWCQSCKAIYVERCCFLLHRHASRRYFCRFLRWMAVPYPRICLRKHCAKMRQIL